MMATLAFIDENDGYYQIEVTDGDPLPGWVENMTPCDVRPPTVAVPTMAQALAALAAQFKQDSLAIAQSVSIAGLANGVSEAAKKAQAQADYADLRTQYLSDYAAIKTSYGF